MFVFKAIGRSNINMRSISAVIVLLLCLVGSTRAFAGAWVKKPGDAYAKLAGSYFQSMGVYDTAGEFESDPGYEYSESSLRLYGEVGLIENASMGLSLPIKQARYEAGQTLQTNGPGDLDLFLKYGTSLGSCVVSGKLEQRIPLYSNETEDSAGIASTDGTRLNDPVLGDGSYETSPMGALGCPVPSVEGWTSVEAGPHFRSGGYGNGLKYAGEFGMFVVPEYVAVKAGVSGVQRYSAQNERATKTYVTTLGSAIFKVGGDFALEFTGSYIPTGYYVSKGWSYGVGLSYDGSLGLGDADN